MAQSHFLLTTIHVVRMISELLRSLQSPVISPQTLSTFDSHFATCQGAFPPECQIYHPQPLQPRYLSPICQLQNCRIVLHRHNLSTSCPPDVRAAALRSCLQVAKETVHLLGRVRQWKPPPGPVGWDDAVASTATTMVCTHIWRCTLFLCFSALYDEALTCARLCAAIGDFRHVNVACGRYLYGFLRLLAAKTALAGDLMQDEMMIALVSGDVQGSTESAWIWNGSETGTALNTSSNNNNNHANSTSSNDNSANGASPPTHSNNSINTNGKPDPVAAAAAASSDGGLVLTADGSGGGGGGWDNIQDIIRQLKREKERREFQPWDPQMNSMPAASGNNNSSRISIANITR